MKRLIRFFKLWWYYSGLKEAIEDSKEDNYENLYGED